MGLVPPVPAIIILPFLVVLFVVPFCVAQGLLACVAPFFSRVFSYFVIIAGSCVTIVLWIVAALSDNRAHASFRLDDHVFFVCILVTVWISQFLVQLWVSRVMKLHANSKAVQDEKTNRLAITTKPSEFAIMRAVPSLPSGAHGESSESSPRSARTIRRPIHEIAFRFAIMVAIALLVIVTLLLIGTEYWL